MGAGERLMRSVIVVKLDEGVEAFLLLQEVKGGGFCGFLFKGEVHPLMTSVLVWIAGFDALDTDPELEPPDRQF